MRSHGVPGAPTIDNPVGRLASGLDNLASGLDNLAGADVVTLDDDTLRDQLLQLVVIGERVQAEVVRRVDAADRRRLHERDGCRSMTSWLRSWARVTGAVGHRWVKAARLLRDLPLLAARFRSGQVSGEQVRQVTSLADRVGVGEVATVDDVLARAAIALDPGRFQIVCDRVRAHIDPDGSAPEAQFTRRQLTVASTEGMLALRGDLDPEGGATVLAALEALSSPPAPGDDRSAGMRRADALVELARRQLASDDLPTVGGQRPQVGVLLFPQALSPRVLSELADAQRGWAAARLREHVLGAASAPPMTSQAQSPQPPAGSPPAVDSTGASSEIDGALPDNPGPDNPGPDGPERDASGMGSRGSGILPSGWADPPWLSGIGAVPAVVAQRIACDADIFRVILDPTSGMPLDVGRTHRLVPHWIRKALWIRDRGCRFTGCTAKVEWTDAHHLTPWSEGGETSVDSCVLLCRFHHGLVHEGGWSIHFESTTGRIDILRPGGIPYRPPGDRHQSWNGPTTLAA